MEENKETNTTVKAKKFYQKWWFWVIVVLVLLLAIGSGSENTTTQTSNNNVSSNNIVEQETEEEKQARLQREAEEKAQKEAEAKAEAEKKAEEERKRQKQEEQNFKNSCSNYTYKEIARNPSNYNGKNVRFTGEVIQVSEDYWGDGVTIRLNVTKDKYGYYDDTIYCTYTYSSGESKILEDDIITIYGTCKGDTSYTSVLGSTITLPKVEIKYLTIQQ